jgi:hypothetical protein
MRVLLGFALLLATAAALGCGNGDSTAADTAGKERIYPWLKGPSREFLVPGGDNVVQTFGEEGTPRERAEATAVIAAWLRARAAKDWKKDCSYFSIGSARELTADAHHVTNGKVKSCPEALAYFKGNASGNFVDTLSGSIDSLRVGEAGEVKGQKIAYAQYHGNDGKDWVVPLEWEGGGWKVTKASPINRLR